MLARSVLLFLMILIVFPCLNEAQNSETLLGIAFIKTKEGKDYVYIKMPPTQFRSAKVRSRVKRWGNIRIGLYGRQMYALKQLLREKYYWKKIIVKVPSKTVRKLKGLKNRYIVCRKELFLKKGKKDFPVTIIENDFDLVPKYHYKRQKIEKWDVSENEYLLLSNVNIIDVKKGVVRKEKGILVFNKRIQKLLFPSEISIIRNSFPIKKEIDLKNRFLIPGMSDIHCHVGLVSEFEMGGKALLYFDAQRMKNTEEAFKSGCTFIRDCGGTAKKLLFLKREIAANRLLGPKIMSSNGAISPKGGMWDVGPVKNKLASLIFGGQLLWFTKNIKDIKKAMEAIHKTGNNFFKFYFEDKPLYGKSETYNYTLFSEEQAEFIVKQARKYGKHIAAHAMFAKGINMLVDMKVCSIEHLSCDISYSLSLAKKMKKNNVAIIPTASLGVYLSMNCGKKGYPDNSEIKYFQRLRERTYRKEVKTFVVPQLQKYYNKFFEWVTEEIEDRTMPMVGQVYPKRIHTFAKVAPFSMINFRKAKTKVGIGTDGGTGLTFCGNIGKELEIFKRYGYSNAELIRMVTLGNMEILGYDKTMGSLEAGKFADMVLLKNNPLVDINDVKKVLMVFKDGRLYYKK